MKKTAYKYIAVIFAALFMVSCGNKENHSENDGHSHDKEEQTSENKDHHEEGEVMLNQQQF